MILAFLIVLFLDRYFGDFDLFPFLEVGFDQFFDSHL